MIMKIMKIMIIITLNDKDGAASSEHLARMRPLYHTIPHYTIP